MNEKEELYFSVKRLIHVLAIRRHVQRQYGPVALSNTEIHILELIQKNEGATSSDIVKILGVTKGAVSQIISKLVQKELIDLMPEKNNRVLRRLHVSEKGKEALIAHEERESNLKARIDQRLSEFTSDDLKKISSIIHSLTDFISEGK